MPKLPNKQPETRDPLNENFVITNLTNYKLQIKLQISLIDSLLRQDFIRIENIVRVEKIFQKFHLVDGFIWFWKMKIVGLLESNAMFSTDWTPFGRNPLVYKRLYQVVHFFAVFCRSHILINLLLFHP